MISRFLLCNMGPVNPNKIQERVEMKKLTVLFFTLPLALSLSVAGLALAASGQSHHYKEHVYYGDISDSNCGAHHKGANARQCTLACVQHGAKYVFVTGGKVLMIENQNLPELEKFAGEHVRIMGTRSAPGNITIASIRAARRRTKKSKA
jgi:hypothetical protein